MLHSTDYRKLRNGNRYQTSNERVLSNHDNTEETAKRRSSKNVNGETPEVHTLTHEVVNEQIREVIAPLTHQLDGWHGK